MSDHQPTQPRFRKAITGFLHWFSWCEPTKAKPTEVLPREALDPRSIPYKKVPVGGVFQADGQTLRKESEELAKLIRLESGELPQRRSMIQIDENRPVLHFARRSQDRA